LCRPIRKSAARNIRAIPQRTGSNHSEVRLPNQYETEKRIVVQIEVATIAVNMNVESGERKKPLAV